MLLPLALGVNPKWTTVGASCSFQNTFLGIEHKKYMTET